MIYLGNFNININAYWTLDIIQTASYEITLVCPSVRH